MIFCLLQQKIIFFKKILISNIEMLEQEAQAWYEKRNVKQKSVDWQFTSEDERIKLKKLYPQF